MRSGFLPSHMPVHSAGNSGHEIQRRQIVSASRRAEAVVIRLNEQATVKTRCAQERYQRQQPAQRQLQQRSQQSSRNDSEEIQDLSDPMQTYSNLFPGLCTYENLLLAFNKAKKRKSKKPYVQSFETNLKSELYKLQWELLTGIYRPAPLTTFIVRDPKTRRISASHFRDRVVHHAICNIIEPIFEKRFIYDSFANRKKKGTSGTLNRFDNFIHKVPEGFALKADIKKYFENLDQDTLMRILGRRIKDAQLLELISIVLKNHKTKKAGKGMPLGNLTSQFFANIYLAELDNFVKHRLRAKYYLRYVDDFIILSQDRTQLQDWQKKIDQFLENELKLSLHPDKTRILKVRDGVPLVGFKVYPNYKILKRSNRLRFFKKLETYKEDLACGMISPEQLNIRLSGWQGYAKMGNTYNLREKIAQEFEGVNMDQTNTRNRRCQMCNRTDSQKSKSCKENCFWIKATLCSCCTNLVTLGDLAVFTKEKKERLK